MGLLFAGKLVAHYGTRTIMLTTAIIASVALILTGLAASAGQLMAALFLVGAARTTFNLSLNTGAVELQKQYNRPILSSFHGIWSLACFVGAAFGTLMIIRGLGPLTHFSIVAVLVSAFAVLLAGRVKEERQGNLQRPFFVKPDRYLFLLRLIGLCAMLCEGAMFDWSVNYFEKVVKVKRSLVTIGYTAFISAMALGRFLGDGLIARLGVYRMLRVNSALIALGFALAGLFPFLLPAALGFLLIGLGDSILVPMIYMLASQSKKMPANYALQAVTLIGYTGFLIGPLFIGNVSQIWGMSSAFLCLSGVSLLIVALSFRVKKLAATHKNPLYT